MEKPILNPVDGSEMLKPEHEKNIREVFNLSPELNKIACESLGIEKKLPNHEAEKIYALYLESIFPESKYKEIGFKGVPQDFSEENRPSFYTTDLEAAKYYASLREGTQTISAVFDFKNPLVVNTQRPAPIPITTPDGKILGSFNDKDINEKIISAGYDALVLNRKFSTPLDGWEILSFNSESRHILGTDFDKERFKRFSLNIKSIDKEE